MNDMNRAPLNGENGRNRWALLGTLSFLEIPPNASISMGKREKYVPTMGNAIHTRGPILERTTDSSVG